MKKTVFYLLLAAAVVSCGKDKFETKPQIKVKSISTKEVTRTRPLNVILEFTDKEGDVSDSLFIIRQRLNSSNPVTLGALPYKIPTFPKSMEGEFEINFDYDRDLTLNLEPIRIPGSNPSRNEADTMRLKIVARDIAGNSSDTLILEDIFVER
jgi:hypothetical protein